METWTVSYDEIPDEREIVKIEIYEPDELGTLSLYHRIGVPPFDHWDPEEGYFAFDWGWDGARFRRYEQSWFLDPDYNALFWFSDGSCGICPSHRVRSAAVSLGATLDQVECL